MREVVRGRKWQILCLVLAIFLAVSVGFNVYQSFSTLADNNSNTDHLLDSDAIAQTSSTPTWLNFTFTWGNESQKIVPGVFRLEICMRLAVGGPSVYLVIRTNDDDYNDWDYIGLVFDQNKDGHIDEWYAGDVTFAFFANNMTQHAVLGEHGFLCFAETMPKPGPQNVTFDPATGYTFTVHFNQFPPFSYTPPLIRGDTNTVHVCFVDRAGGGVYVRFPFYVPEE